jgi:uncharacterized DUF497 family protein
VYAYSSAARLLSRLTVSREYDNCDYSGAADEQRWHAIGRVREAILLVAHVYWEEQPNGEEAIRIISAREANSRERRSYLEQAVE